MEPFEDLYTKLINKIVEMTRLGQIIWTPSGLYKFTANYMNLELRICRIDDFTTFTVLDSRDRSFVSSADHPKLFDQLWQVVDQNWALDRVTCGEVKDPIAIINLLQKLDARLQNK